MYTRDFPLSPPNYGTVFTSINAPQSVNHNQHLIRWSLSRGCHQVAHCRIPDTVYICTLYTCNMHVTYTQLLARYLFILTISAISNLRQICAKERICCIAPLIYIYLVKAAKCRLNANFKETAPERKVCRSMVGRTRQFPD